MTQICADTLKEVIKTLCVKANTNLPTQVYDCISNIYTAENNKSARNCLAQILSNAHLAQTLKRPLCQDTGIVTVYLHIGQNVEIKGQNIETTILKAVKEAYCENFYRKSIVKEPLFNRINTQDNTPAIIHTEIVPGNEIDIVVAVKGAGCENMTKLAMLKPADDIEGVMKFIIEAVKSANCNPCPPIKLGIGIGGNSYLATDMAQKALLPYFNNKKKTAEIQNLEQEIMGKVNTLNIGVMGLGGNNTCFDVSILTAPCHIASLPVAVAINCHSLRYSSAKITENAIKYENIEEYQSISQEAANYKEYNTKDIYALRNVKSGENILLTGEIYTARDAAHAKLYELIKSNKPLPIELKNSIIFYAGPCPAKDNEIIGPIGPTTASRMDKYLEAFYQNGLFATIGKGKRSDEAEQVIKIINGAYFTVTGGVSTLLMRHVKSAQVVAYAELGTEAIQKLYVDKLPVIKKI